MDWRFRDEPTSASVQSQHILHAVQPGLFSRQPLGGADGAAGEGVAAVGAVDEFEALADAAEDHGMFADDVAGADRQQGDFFFAARTDQAFAAVLVMLNRTRYP